ncbi:MAG TPA: SDR family NAD(P)-dependent oxidoreductase [Chloroflexota bacterium]|nr:SDR family NAD(P)-dependent oxidoreductase [Chloroflexota bacterium]
MDLGLRGKVVLVTGGAGRIGPVICQTFVREGALVAVLDVAADRAAATAAQLRQSGGQAIGLGADVSRATDVEAALRTVTERLGAVDVLVNAHGISPNRPLLQANEEEWDRTFAVNTRGTMLTCRAVGNQMIERGSGGAIVNVSSGAATSARLGAAGYSGSKAAINMLTEALAIELGPHGIRVNAVAPGLVTDAALKADDPTLTPYMRMMLDMTPLGRTGAPADIAEVVVFVASACNAWMSGSIVDVSGGSHTGRPHVPLPRPPEA